MIRHKTVKLYSRYVHYKFVNNQVIAACKNRIAPYCRYTFFEEQCRDPGSRRVQMLCYCWLSEEYWYLLAYEERREWLITPCLLEDLKWSWHRRLAKTSSFSLEEVIIQPSSAERGGSSREVVNHVLGEGLLPAGCDKILSDLDALHFFLVSMGFDFTFANQIAFFSEPWLEVGSRYFVSRVNVYFQNSYTILVGKTICIQWEGTEVITGWFVVPYGPWTSWNNPLLIAKSSIVRPSVLDFASVFNLKSPRIITSGKGYSPFRWSAVWLRYVMRS